MSARRASWIALLAALAASPSVGSAMRSNCAGCLDNCCSWAFSASRGLASGSIDAYSAQRWERWGFPPAPCREALHDAAAYQRCVNKAFDRCYASRCRGCRPGWVPLSGLFRRKDRLKSVEFHPGQIIVIPP